MSKRITKVIAALGVVAGLGIAALPLSSYASNASVDVTVTVAGSFSITTDPTLATCTNSGGANLPSTSYGGVTLNFTDSTSTPSDASGICLQSNSTGDYDISIGTPYATYDTTALYSETVSGSEATATASQKIPAASGAFTAGTAAWGYTFNGANRGASSTTGAINADTAGTYVAPVQFGSGFTGGRNLGSSVQIPNGVGDYYGMTVGATVTPAHNGEYNGSLVFYAVANITP